MILKWARQQISLSGHMTCSDDRQTIQRQKKLNQTNVTSGCKLVKLVEKFTFFWKFCPSTPFVDLIPWRLWEPLHELRITKGLAFTLVTDLPGCRPYRTALHDNGILSSLEWPLCACAEYLTTEPLFCDP